MVFLLVRCSGGWYDIVKLTRLTATHWASLLQQGNPIQKTLNRGYDQHYIVRGVVVKLKPVCDHLVGGQKGGMGPAYVCVCVQCAVREPNVCVPEPIQTGRLCPKLERVSAERTSGRGR